MAYSGREREEAESERKMEGKKYCQNPASTVFSPALNPWVAVAQIRALSWGEQRVLQRARQGLVIQVPGFSDLRTPRPAVRPRLGSPGPLASASCRGSCFSGMAGFTWFSRNHSFLHPQTVECFYWPLFPLPDGMGGSTQ